MSGPPEATGNRLVKTMDNVWYYGLFKKKIIIFNFKLLFFNVFFYNFNLLILKIKKNIIWILLLKIKKQTLIVQSIS
jgi:hypothetical protein